MAVLPQETMQMTKWPNTPTPRRLQDALLLYQETVKFDVRFMSVESKDGRFLQRMVKATSDFTEISVVMSEPDWQELANETLLSRIQELGDSQLNRIKILSAIAAVADEEDTIGLAVMSPQEKPDGEKAVAMGLSRILRRPEWMGFNNMLPRVKGTAAIVRESRKIPGKLGYVVCVPTSLPTEEDEAALEETTLKLPHAEQLKKILLWHGAARILWNPVQPGTKPDQGI